jgi:hypothetical protein
LAAGVWAALASSDPAAQPDPDVCDVAGDATISQITFGSGDGAFVAWQSGEAVDFVEGGQGTPMLPVRMRLEGSQIPACIAQTTSLLFNANVIGSEATPLKTYDEGDGSRTTLPLYVVIFDLAPGDGEGFQVTATVGGTAASLDLVRELQ